MSTKACVNGKLAIFLLLMIPAACPAIRVTLFIDIDLYAMRGKEIVIGKCLSIVPNKPNTFMLDGVYHVEIEVIRTLKGSKDLGKQTIATIYPMTTGKTYLLYSLGDRTNFYAVPELSVVEVPPNFVWDGKKWDERPLRDQLLLLFRARLAQVDQELAEKTSLTLSTLDKSRQAVWAKLKDASPSDGVTQYLTNQLSAGTRNLLSTYGPPFRSDNVEAALWHSFLDDLNRIIRSGPLYDANRFAGVKLSTNTSTLLARNPQGADVVRLNIALLLDAYPVGLWRDRDLESEKALLEKATAEPSAPSRWFLDEHERPRTNHIRKESR